MKTLQALFLLKLILLFSCENTNIAESPESELVLRDSIAQTDSSAVEVYVWVDKLRLRKSPDTKSEILQELQEGEVLLFLNEKSHFKEKINLRGTIYDEPWLKVRTSKNITGWIFGGAVKFEKPVFNYSPSPFEKCVSDFLQTKNRESFAQCNRKVKDKQLKIAQRFITKTDDGYVLKLLSGETRTFQNSMENNEDFREYEYLYYIEKLGYFVFRVNFHEAGQYLLVDDKFGYSRPISGFPSPAPDYKHFIITNADGTAGFEFNGVQIFGFSDYGLEILYEKEYDIYEPYLPKWLDEKTVQFELIPIATAKNKKPTQITISQNENGEWSE